MPSILRDLPAVAWVAGKNFNFKGKSYQVGDEVPEINEFPRLEVFVRTRTVIPVVDSIEDTPFQFRHTVMTRERAQHKLSIGHPAGGPSDRKHSETTVRDLGNTSAEQESAEEVDENEFNPANHSIDEVMEYVEENPDEVLSVYALEEQGKDRPRLKKKLDEILNRQAEEENEESDNE